MKVGIYQMNIAWCDAPRNRKKVQDWIASLSEDIGIVILPEMFNTGFSMEPNSCTESMQGDTLKWVVETSRNNNKAIVCSIAISEGGKNYNRMVFIKPSGEVVKYDKRHLFRVSGENKLYNSGSERIVVEYGGIRFLMQVCYDLRFPVWSRNRGDYDAIIYVANWPKSRISAWDVLLRARAIENSCYVIGANRVGEDPITTYCGNSQINNFLGCDISTISLYGESAAEATLIANLDMDLLHNYREKFPTHLDADDFQIIK